MRDGNLAKAEEALTGAEEKGISSIDLLLANGELKKAILEAEKQSRKENADRQYADFVQYYEKAKKLLTAPSQGQDVEMQLLDKLYQQLEEAGWLK